jgi:hypothetical protein
VTAREMADEIAVHSDGPTCFDAETKRDEQWRRVMAAFEDLTDAYYGEGRTLRDATIIDIVIRFFRQCHEMKHGFITATVESPDLSPAPLHHFWPNTRDLEICDAMFHAEGPAMPGSRKVTARIQRTYSEPKGNAYAIIEYAREGEPPRATDAMVIAENCVNAWTRFLRKQGRAGASCAARPATAELRVG